MRILVLFCSLGFVAASGFEMFAPTLADEAVVTIAPVGPVEIIQQGFEFTEGPAWDANSRSLYFSDIPQSSIHKLTDAGKLITFTKDSKHTNGMFVTAAGRLLACQMDGQVVSYNQANGDVTVIAGEFDGKRFVTIQPVEIDLG